MENTTRTMLHADMIGESGCSIQVNCSVSELMAIFGEVFATVIIDQAERYGHERGQVYADVMSDIAQFVMEQMHAPSGERTVITLAKIDKDNDLN